MTDGAFVSYAQNGEDVVLHRALAGVERGRYVDVGANDPTVDSVTRAFYEAGWRGITVEPVHEYADRQRSERPGDVLVEAVVTQRSGETVTLHEVPDTGLSTLDGNIADQHRGSGFEVVPTQVPTLRLDEILQQAGWTDSQDIHFLSVDVEGAEAEVLASLDLRRWRPWIIVAEATRPQTSEPSHDAWEPLLTSAGYRFSLFDGLSRYYIADERWDQLHADLSAPANALDRFVRYERVQREQRIEDLEAELAGLRAVGDETAAELADLRTSLADARSQQAAATDQLEKELASGRERQVELEDRAARATEREAQATATALAWRNRAMGVWADTAALASAASTADVELLRRQNAELGREMAAIRATLSWRVTGPLRAARLIGKANR